MSLDPNLKEDIVQRLLEVDHPERIILFGSAATGTMTRDSDIDLLILESNADNSREKTLRLHDALEDLGYPIDIIIMPLERFEESKNIVGSIAYPAHKYGQVIYDAA